MYLSEKTKLTPTHKTYVTNMTYKTDITYMTYMTVITDLTHMTAITDITDMMSVMKGHVQLYWKIRGPYSDMGYTTQLRLLRTGQGNNTRTPLN